jgi:hypothetical protein
MPAAVQCPHLWAPGKKALPGMLFMRIMLAELPYPWIRENKTCTFDKM